MDVLTLGNAEWSTTFPGRVAPYDDEWLVSLLLRSDEINQWESGETFRYLLRSTDHPGFGPQASLLVVPFSVLECLAHVLMISPHCLLATTYSAELARLYPSHPPHSKLLLGPRYYSENWVWKRRRGPRELSIKREIHLCPACIAHRRLIKRTEALPYLQYCPLHHIAFQEQCCCGAPLIFFSRGVAPFACSRCGLDWAQWPQIPIPPDRVALEHDLWVLYEFFLAQGTEELKVSALRLALGQIRNESLHLRLSGRKMLQRTIPVLSQHSLGYIVDILVSVGISPKDIANAEVSLL
ncbi:MAG TPA: hypothetical protein VGL94_07175 [Ktedonobacteraceae bacterium]